MAGGKKNAGPGKGKGGKSGSGQGAGGKLPKLPAVSFEDFDEADRIFRETLDRMGPVASPEKDRDDPPGKIQRDKSAKASARGRGGAGSPGTSIDLHRMTLAEAKARLDDVFAALLQRLSGSVTVTIITGKGLHSGPGGAVLPREIHRYVQQAYGGYILRIDDSPDEVRIAGVPLRGHFNVTLGRR